MGLNAQKLTKVRVHPRRVSGYQLLRCNNVIRVHVDIGPVQDLLDSAPNPCSGHGMRLPNRTEHGQDIEDRDLIDLLAADDGAGMPNDTVFPFARAFSAAPTALVRGVEVV
jgi:hypothetical protein